MGEMAPINSQVGDGTLHRAACHLVEAAAEVRRDGNTDEFMERLAEAMNRICELVGEGDAIGYLRLSGRFIASSGMGHGVKKQSLTRKTLQPLNRIET